jgi:LysM repeat protein
MIKKRNKKILFSGLVALGLGLGITATSTKADATTIDSNTYEVQAGDCFWTIAQKYNLSVKYLEEINGMNDNSLLLPNDKLKLSDANQPVYNQSNTQSATVAVQNTQSTTNEQTTINNANTNDVNTSSAKEWIASRESGGSYNAQNGQYIGRYQLSASYLNGDYSPANQERVADRYVASRYGSWEAAKAFWQANGWY